MVHSSKPNSSCIFNNIPSNCFKTHKQVQMLYTRDIAASFQVLTPHGVPLDNKQPKSQRSKRWCDSILLISFIDIVDLLKWVKIDFFTRSFNVLMIIESFFKMNKGPETDSLTKTKHRDEDRMLLKKILL